MSKIAGMLFVLFFTCFLLVVHIFHNSLFNTRIQASLLRQLQMICRSLSVDLVKRNWFSKHFWHFCNDYSNTRNKAFVDIRPVLPSCESLWALASPLPDRLCANMMSSTEPEVLKWHCRQRTEPLPQLTRKKIGEVNFGLQTVGVAILDEWSLRYVSGQTDRHTNTLTAILRTLPAAM